MDGADSQKRHSLCKRKSKGRAAFACSSSKMLGVVGHVAARFEDLLLAFGWVGGEYGNEAYVCRQTGEIHYYSGFGDNEEPLPEDINDAEKYVALPDKRDLGLGKPLALQFAELSLPDDIERVTRIFSRSGAYASFKDLLEHRALLDQWYEFEGASQERELRKWCEIEGIEIET